MVNKKLIFNCDLCDVNKDRYMQNGIRTRYKRYNIHNMKLLCC